MMDAQSGDPPTADRLLSLESTCDETAAAVIDSRRRVLASAIASQEQLHRRFSGVVPEIAARAHLEAILPLVDHVLAQSSGQPSQLVAVAVATHPGLAGALMVGLSAAKGLCLAWDKPLVAINHIQAHIYACQMESTESIYPCVGLVVSGGHTHLYRCDSPVDWSLLGGTIDDAAGEAFDKVAVMLGLPFPGGPALAALAERGDATAVPLPRPMMTDRDSLQLSFSGLKTAVRYRLVGAGKHDFSQLHLSEQERADIAASFQQAVIDCLVSKAVLACKLTGLKQLCVGGGVAANASLRRQLGEACQRRGISLNIAPAWLCTDNAAMGGLAWEKIERGRFDPLDIDITPGLQR